MGRTIGFACFGFALTVGTSADDSLFIGKLTGPVTKVRDADTIEVAGVPVRLQGVAAPELDEPGGPAAAAFARNLILGRQVECSLTGEQSRDRVIGVCSLDGVDVGELVIRAGHARDCPHFSGGRYISAEVVARKTGRDLSKLYPLPSYCAP